MDNFIVRMEIFLLFGILFVKIFIYLLTPICPITFIGRQCRCRAQANAGPVPRATWHAVSLVGRAVQGKGQ